MRAPAPGSAPAREDFVLERCVLACLIGPGSQNERGVLAC